MEAKVKNSKNGKVRRKTVKLIKEKKVRALIEKMNKDSTLKNIKDIMEILVR